MCFVVDGFAAVPHAYANNEESGVDWYAMSYHKLFVPHLEVPYGRINVVKGIMAVGSGGWDRREDEDVYRERV